MDASLPDPRSAFKAFISRPPLPKQKLGDMKMRLCKLATSCVAGKMRVRKGTVRPLDNKE
jgi:hypothetical protein